jgi:hypothetical protein
MTRTCLQEPAVVLVLRPERRCDSGRVGGRRSALSLPIFPSDSASDAEVCCDVCLALLQGYRDAQCGWLLPPASHPAAALGLLLVLYAPKRQVLEVWLPRSGQRLVGVPVDYPCLLVSVGLPCGGWGNATAWEAWLQQCGSATTLVVNMETGATWDALSCLEEE